MVVVVMQNNQVQRYERAVNIKYTDGAVLLLDRRNQTIALFNMQAVLMVEEPRPDALGRI